MHPVLIQIGPLTIRWYGAMMAAAVLLSVWLAGREGVRKGFEKEKIQDFCFFVIIAGIVGARLYFVLFSDLSSFLAKPLRLFAFWEGGLAIHGAIIGGIVVALWYTWRKRIPFWKWTDTFAPSLILGQAIGRIGCFLNGDAHGYPTTLPWGLIYAPDSPAGQMFPNQPLHPTQLYELGFNLGIFLILWQLRKKNFFDGFLFLMYVILYSSIRIFVEYFRADKLTYLGDVSAAQTLGIAAIAISLGLIIALSRRERMYQISR